MKKTITTPRQAASARTLDRIDKELARMIEEATFAVLRLRALLAMVRGAERR
jgi:hypothetical protein